MTPIGTIIQALETQILASYTSATVYFDQVLEKNDNTPMPLFEINRIKKSTPNFSASVQSSYIFQIIQYQRTLNDKLTLAGFEEKEVLDRALIDCIDAWHTNILSLGLGVAELENIDSTPDTLSSGEYGGLDKNVVRIITQFQINIMER